jgi:hypothetical protein
MNEPSFLPPPPQIAEPPASGHSPLGIVSFVIGLLATFLLCAALGLSMYTNSASLAYQTHQTVLQVVGFMALCSGGVGFIGLVLGIVSVVQKGKNKLFGIIGLVLCALNVIGLCLIMGLGVIASAGSL